MADDFKAALSTPLPEGGRRILLLISWVSFVLFSIVIVVCSIGFFYESGIERFDKSDPLAGFEKVNPDGTKSTIGGERVWSSSNISPFVLITIPGAIVAVLTCRWICFKAFPKAIGYVYAVAWWIVMGFKRERE